MWVAHYVVKQDRKKRGTDDTACAHCIIEQEALHAQINKGSDFI